MPVEYSAVTVRTASAPSRTAAIMTPNSEALVGSKRLALLGGHGGPLAELGEATATVKPMARATASGGRAPGGGQGAKLGPLCL